MRDRERDDASAAALQKALKPLPKDKDDEPFVHKVVKWVKPFDASAVHLDSNVPVPEKSKGPKGSRYNRLFERMQEGDSCLLPIDLRKPIQSSAQIWRKQGHMDWHFATRVESETQFRFWRLKDSPSEADTTATGSAD